MLSPSLPVILYQYRILYAGGCCLRLSHARMFSHSPLSLSLIVYAHCAFPRKLLCSILPYMLPYYSLCVLILREHVMCSGAGRNKSPKTWVPGPIFRSPLSLSFFLALQYEEEYRTFM
jgi:hypothetical protein